MKVEMATPHTRGSTFMPKFGLQQKERLPRIRGDRPTYGFASTLTHLATPHTRGSTLSCHQRLRPCEGYPAYAGIDPVYPDLVASGFRLPRIRGDRPSRIKNTQKACTATPHTRGSTLLRKRAEDRIAGYPAYAGIDPIGTAGVLLHIGATPHTRGSTSRQE